MYSLFSKEEKYNFTAQYGVVDYVFNIKGLSTMAKTIYQVFLGELKYLHHSNKLKIDDKGIYVEMARSLVGEKVNACSHTVAKYIKELQRYGLLIDRRMGLKLCNRIYLKYRTDAKRYETNNSENKKEQKNSGIKPASNIPLENPLINKAKEIITQLTDESLPYRTINQMLILCKDNLEDLKAAVQDCFGKTARVSVAAMLMDNLKNEYYKKKQKRKEEKAQKSIDKPKVSKRVADFNKMEEHGDWNFDAIEKGEILLNSLRLKEITEEEYYSEIAKLNICGQ